MLKLLIVIPAYNEAENIGKVIRELEETAPEYDYVVINDGSADRTAEICREKGIPLLDLPVNLGLTGAFQTGMRYACEQGYDAAIQIDADGQHDPHYIPEMVRVMEEREADLVIGSRFVTEKKPHTVRMAGSALIEFCIRVTTGKRLTDPTSGMRLYGKRVLKQMAYGVNFRPEPDTMAHLIRSGYKLEEVQVTMRERTAGDSYLTIGPIMRYMLLMCMDILFIQWARKKE